MRLIDADILAELLKREAEHHESDGLLERSYGVLDAYMDVLGAPTIDAVPVIRCKYCEHYKEEIGFHNIKYMVCKISAFNHPLRKEGDFCSKGEMKTDGTVN